MADYKLNYDNETVANFTEGELLTFGGGGIAELILLYDDGSTGELYVSLISGSVPADDETIVGGTSGALADVDGTPYLSRFPVNIRNDISKNASDDIRWTGAALGTTHSCKFDNEAVSDFAVAEIVTFGNGSTAEVIAVTDNGSDGELFLRMIGIDLPPDNDTIVGGTSSTTANVDGAFHIRAYTPTDIHFWFSDKGDDAAFAGDDVHDRTRPQISRRIGTTDVLFLGNANIDDTMSYHMYGGSLTQGGGSPTEYNAVAISIVDVDGATEPVIIQDNALHSDTTGEYWNNAFMPNAASVINLLIKVNVAGTVVDRRVVRFRALEYLRQYFTAPDPTLGGGITPVSLVATDDGNNTTAAGTVSGWTDAVFSYGYATVDHNNGNGAQPYWAIGDTGSRTKAQFHERFKWEQRRGTAETVFGLDASLLVGNDLDVVFDNEAVSNFAEGETVTFGNGGTALVLGVNGTGTGTLYCQRLTGDAPLDDDTIVGGTSSTTADVDGDSITRLIITNLVGTFTGSAFNPANRGITLEAADATNADLFTDLLGATQQPPNNQSGTINTATDNIATIYPWDGTAVDTVGDQEPHFDRLTKDGAESGAAVTSITVNEAIPTWMPQGGYIRVTLVSGLRRLVAVTSWTGLVITIPSTDFSGDNIADAAGIMPSPVDEAVVAGQVSFTGVYTIDQDGDGSGDQQFVIRVQNGSAATPKQPSTTTATFESGGFSVNVSLTDD